MTFSAADFAYIGNWPEEDILMKDMLKNKNPDTHLAANILLLKKELFSVLSCPVDVILSFR